MGKRKERRLAAMTSSGRRVKLDLFAEPSGDMGGSSEQDEVIGGEDDSKSRAGLTNSPSSSSSGQKPENPLLLLGQYSDDELDEESSRSLNNAIVENFLADLDNQTKDAADKEGQQNNASNVAAEKVQQHDVENVSASPDILQSPEGNSVRENDGTDPQREVETTEPVAVNCDVQVDGDVSSGWKLVFHEESNKYYYWNTVTGETSWDVPHGLIHKTDDDAAAGGVGNNVVLGMELEHVDTIASLPSDGTRAETPNCKTKEISQGMPEMDVSDEGRACDATDSKNESLDVDTKISNSPSSQPYHKISPAKKQSHDALLVNGEDDEIRTNLSSSIVKQGEYLLDKLLSLKSSQGHLEGKEQISKHILEVELRLHDIKSLSSYGSSLLPFWLHSERQLNHIEATINELVQSFELEKASNFEATQENVGDDIRRDSEDSQPSDHEVVEDDNNVGHSKSVQYGEVLAELSSAAAIQAEEDMDVEMEVEDVPNPPPPDDDWIPPPPPEEPPESTFPPPQPSEADTFSYAQQYNLTYPVPNFEFYAQTSTVPAGGYYSLADGRQLAAPLPIYYNTYPVETVSYYGLQDGTGSSGSVGQSHVQVGSTSSHQAKSDDISGGAVRETTTSYASASAEAPATISVIQATPTVTTTTALATETVPKVQSKARAKKKATAVVSSLRSNKKVSSLVDKWKAAKDELHEEEEDEPENAYELLEKKRRREIEEWRARQIASGEAKDNANFQPLGGDWRERVKRKRAQMVKEETSLLSSEDDGGLGDAKRHQPEPGDVDQVSKGLPSGWKAYWDESSKLFYYANSLISETTWIKPTS